MEHEFLSRVLGEPRIGDADDEPPQDVGKSVSRALQVLELFDVIEREALVYEVSELLGFPQSSTSVLLRSMVSLGYLYFNRETRGFGPTSRVALLGRWINEPTFGDGEVFRVMKLLNEQFSTTSVLATRNQIWTQNIHVMQSPHPERLYIVKGARRPLTRSTLGMAMLSRLKDSEIKRIMIRINSEEHGEVPPIHISALMEQIDRIRQQGYAFMQEMIVKGLGMIAVNIASAVPGELLAVGVGDRNQCLEANKQQILEILADLKA